MGTFSASTQISDDTVVLSKTEAGQRMAICAVDSLGPLEHTLLSVVNGRTPLRYLVDLVALQGAGLPDAIEHLLNEGLIAIAARDDTRRQRAHLADRRTGN